MRFANILFLLLLVVIPFLIRHFRDPSARKQGSLRFSNVSRLKEALPSGLIGVYRFLPILRILIVVLLILGLARPQTNKGDESIETEGIDIILTLDVSGSMQAEDFQPNRLEAAKKVAADFIRGRKNDRIGLVVFAGHSATQAPLTVDYDVLLSLLEKVHIGMLQEDGTAIGMAIANSVNRLRNSTATSKVIVVLTDGVNNKGEIDPLTAANLATSMQQRIYTIGAGSQGEAYVTVVHPLLGKQRQRIRAELDESTLRKVAEMTDGKYFRATDEKSLASIYEEIEQLEKSKIDVKQYKDYVELFPYLVYAALGLLCVEILLNTTRFRRVP
ncbi:aerotolerance regulator BatA [candidate division KSB3 bacterium]|uniref:Aerotolerance regulator BatA n=1 Tax=candidate division KSB3 bacterium TaxID=2044937 RepID=A0A2G6E1K6_9BACT|nr:MAG: aerotolerance regulator BatA [candidate division KSB3 bacterium]PIE28594.1 MAG: aerotolerance regulator BatA [candidate division KSB3 bacterium]